MDWILDVGPVGMFLITSIGGFVLYLLTKAVVKAPGTVLQTKFMALGTLTGKTYDEIVEVCGAPNVSPSMDGIRRMNASAPNTSAYNSHAPIFLRVPSTAVKS